MLILVVPIFYWFIVMEVLQENGLESTTIGVRDSNLSRVMGIISNLT